MFGFFYWFMFDALNVQFYLGATPTENVGVGLYAASPRAAKKRRCGLSSPIPCARATWQSSGIFIRNKCIAWV